MLVSDTNVPSSQIPSPFNPSDIYSNIGSDSNLGESISDNNTANVAAAAAPSASVVENSEGASNVVRNEDSTGRSSDNTGASTASDVQNSATAPSASRAAASDAPSSREPPLIDEHGRARANLVSYISLKLMLYAFFRNVSDIYSMAPMLLT